MQDMKHCAKCRFEKHLRFFTIKKAGLLGVILMVAHLVFHIVELLILPAILVAFSSHATEEPVMAATKTEERIEFNIPLKSQEGSRCSQNNIILESFNKDSYLLPDSFCLSLPLQY